MLSIAFLVPFLTIGWLAHSLLFNEITSEKMRLVGTIAESKHAELVAVLSRGNARAQAFSAYLVTQCGNHAGGVDRACAYDATRMYVQTENATGALLHWKGGSDDLKIGNPLIRIDEIPPFGRGQLARFTARASDSERSYYLQVADPATGFQLFIVYPLDLIQSIFVPQSALGKAGEIFLTDSAGRLMTKARNASLHDNRAIPITAVPMQTCLNRQDAEVLDLDYRQIPIIHGFRFVPEIGGGCVMAHVSQEEAFAPLRGLTWRLAAIAVGLVGLAMLAAAYLSRRFVQPLENLTSVARAITKGNNEIYTPAEDSSEISKLASAFNIMTAQLAAKERRLADAQRIAQLGSWEFDIKKRKLTVSDEMFRIFEIDPNSGIVSRAPFLHMIHPEDRNKVEQLYTETLKSNAPYELIHRLRMEDGRIKWLHERCVTQFDAQGAPLYSSGIVQDISERKMVDDALRRSFAELRRLSDHQEKVKENERKRIARDIHDELGQNLLAVKMDVSVLHARTAGTHPRLHERVGTVLNNVNATIASVKTIMNDLRPATLELGLCAAVEWQARQFERGSGIACKLMGVDKDTDAGLSEEQTATVFRILQESLTNIARHSRATAVEIVLSRSDHGFCMKVADNGAGIGADDRRKGNTFGLMGIRERVLSFGGELTIESNSGRGTLLSITIPWEPQTGTVEA